MLVRVHLLAEWINSTFILDESLNTKSMTTKRKSMIRFCYHIENFFENADAIST